MGSKWSDWWHREKLEKKTEDELMRQIIPDKLPRHIAIIMDGNGRWAKRRGLPRLAGHRAGMKSLKEVVRGCGELKIEVLTVFAFSTENWKRPVEEINGLMSLLVEYIQKELDELHQEGVKVQAIGEISKLPVAAQKELARAEKLTSHNQGLILNIALNYGGRNEIVKAIRHIAQQVKEEKLLINDIDESLVARYLYTAGLPNPDLLIRPSGEMRISNFLLWQIAYTELWVSSIMWPDFRKSHLLEAILAYQRRDRRYGGVKS